MIEMPDGEVVAVYMMFDADGNPTEDREQARMFGVVRENGKEALLRLPHPGANLEKISRH